jgi:hypothetical protein
MTHAVASTRAATLCLLLFIGLNFGKGALAQTYFYVGADYGEWSNSSNWSPAGIPGSGDTAWISNNQVWVFNNTSIGSLHVSYSVINVSGSATLTCETDGNLGTSSIEGNGTLRVNSGATLFTANASSVVCSFMNYGSIRAVSGTLTLHSGENHGELNGDSGEIYIPPASYVTNYGNLNGIVRIGGWLDQVQDSAATGYIVIDDGGMGGYSTLTVSGYMSVSGQAWLGTPLAVSASGALVFQPGSLAEVRAPIDCFGGVGLIDCTLRGFSEIRIHAGAELRSTTNFQPSCYVAPPIRNFGTVNAMTGNLELGAPGYYTTHTNEIGGVFTSSTGASIVLPTNATLNNSGQLNGTVVVRGLYQQIANSTCAGILDVNGGTMTGYSTLTVSGTMKVEGWSWLATPTDVAISGGLQFLPGSHGEVRATLNCSGQASITDCSVYGFSDFNLLQSGFLTSSVVAQSGNAILAPFHNMGFLYVANGELSLGNASSGIAAWNDNLMASEVGAKVVIPSGASFYNSGLLHASIDMHGIYYQSVNSESFGTFNLLDGSMGGPATLTVNGPLNVSGYCWLGTSLSIVNYGSLNFLPGSHGDVRAPISCGNTINVTDCNVYGYSPGSLSLSPSGTLNSQVVTQTANAIQISVNNSGLIKALSGNLQLASFVQNTGTLTSNPSAKIVVPVGGFVSNNGTISGTADIAGMLYSLTALPYTGTLNITGSLSGYFSAMNLEGTLNLSGYQTLNMNLNAAAGSAINLLPGTTINLNAVIDAAGAVNLNNSTLRGGEFVLESGGNLVATSSTLAANIIVSYGSVRVLPGTLDLENNYLDVYDGTVRLEGGTINGWVTMNDGVVTGSGTIKTLRVFGGTVQPTGTLNLTSAYLQYYGALQLGLRSATDFDKVAAQFVILGGALNIATQNGYAPTSQDVFGIVTASAANILGAFSTTSLPAGEEQINLPTVVQIRSIPVLSTVAPNFGVEYGPNVNIAVSGTGFVSGSFLRLNHVDLPTTFSPSTAQLLSTINCAGLSAGTYSITARNQYGTLESNVLQFIVKGHPGVAFPNHARTLVYGTPLGNSELDATAQVPGTFVYSPSAGTVLPVGMNYFIFASFTPDDIVHYVSDSAVAFVTVTKATPVITWANPGNIVYGTALGAAQLNASASAPGTFVYTPAAGTVLNAGNGQTLSVAFTPTDAANYTSANASVAINVAKATPTITWANPADIVYGTALGAAQLNATASVPGTFVYTPAAGTVLNSGNGQTLSVAFTPTDAANYTSANASVAINVAKATPTITWANPADIVYGTALGAGQLNATASVPGTFVYAPASGMVLNAGNGQTLSVAFTPTNGANYNSANASVTINVAKATPAITWANPADIVYGTALGAAQLNANASVAGTFVYTPASGTVLSAGNAQTLSVAFTPTDSANYTSANASVAVNVAKATPTIIWANPADIVYGTTLGAAQLNASASVPGTFVYTPAAGTVLNAGNGQTLSVAFTPTNGANYTSANASVTINVTKATPTITWANPADIVYGTALGAAQLNASASVPGTLVYTPASGTVLNAGNGQTLSVAFTPTNGANYTSTGKNVSLNVVRASPQITWANPANIVHGTALSATQLNASANVPGVFAYSPAAGTILPRGNNQVLSVVFDPDDDANYILASADVMINVLNAPPAFTSGAGATPNPVRYNASVSLTASASDLENDALSYSWNFGDGSAAGSGASVAHIYTAAGDYTATVTVSDGQGGSANSSVVVHVNPNAAPTVAAAASSSTNPMAGGSSNLSVLGADDMPESALIYTWSTVGTPPGAVTFSINGTNASKNTTATFAKVGTYTLRATIRDVEGATVTSNVNVTVSPVTVTFQDGVNSYAGTTDTHIKNGSQNTNFGTATAIEVAGGNADTGALIKWNLSSIPAGSTIQSVKITLNVTDASTQSYNIYDVKRAWVESTATWKIWNTGQNWQTNGAEGANDRGSTSLGTVIATPVGSRTTTLNAAGIAVVQSWVNNSATNNGFIFSNYSATNDNVIFSSREAATATQRPKIEIIYAP